MKECIIEIIRDGPVLRLLSHEGMDETRQFLVDRVNTGGGTQITPEDIIFFNGLW